MQVEDYKKKEEVLEILNRAMFGLGELDAYIPNHLFQQLLDAQSHIYCMWEEITKSDLEKYHYESPLEKDCE